LTLATGGAHPTEVGRFANVMAVVILVLTTAPGNLAMCAGWKPTPEARRACCAAGAMCPMRAHTDGTAARHAVSQWAADACCAAADRDDAPPASAFALAGPVAVLALAMAPIDSRPDWQRVVRAFESPPPSAAVSRHLLLSVILI
jgi:hypothetical protein